MFLDFFGIRENPFSNTPDPHYLYMSRRHEEALAHLQYGVESGTGFVLLTGEVGTGKTTVSRCLIERLPENVDVALCVNPRLQATELLAYICDEMRIEAEGSRSSAKDLTDSINAHLLDLYGRGRRAVLIIDEAQNLDAEMLEQVRLLTNLETTKSKLLQIVLIGQPELKVTLARPELRQLSQRVTARYHLEPLDKSEIGSYVMHRLRVVGLARELFDRGALDEIFAASGGVPRIVNSICERCLLGAYSRGEKHVDRHLARAAAGEVLGGKSAAEPDAFKALLYATAGAALGLFAVAFLVADPLGWGVFPERTRAAIVKTVASLGFRARLSGEETENRDEAEPGPSVSAGAQVGDGGPAATETGQGDTDVETTELVSALGEVGTDGSFRTAIRGLFSLWGQRDLADSGPDPCENAGTMGLRCLSWRGDWSIAEKLDRPVLLSLAGPGGERVYGVMTAIDGDTLKLRIGERTLGLERAEVLANLTGDFLVLWRPPAEFERVLEPGLSGPDVSWVRRRLAGGDGAGVGSDLGSDYDPSLRAMVDAFKRRHGMPEDGVVDERMWILLNSLKPDPDVPVISDGG